MSELYQNTQKALGIQYRHMSAIFFKTVFVRWLSSQPVHFVTRQIMLAIYVSLIVHALVS